MSLKRRDLTGWSKLPSLEAMIDGMLIQESSLEKKKPCSIMMRRTKRIALMVQTMEQIKIKKHLTARGIKKKKRKITMGRINQFILRPKVNRVE